MPSLRYVVRSLGFELCRTVLAVHGRVQLTRLCRWQVTAVTRLCRWQVTDYEKELAFLRGEVLNVREMADVLPTGCYNRITLEP